MKNLTEKQQTIIAEITSEFAKINQEKATRKTGGLLDVDTLLFERDQDIEWRKKIEIENRIAKEKFMDAVKRDMDRLNEDLKHLKLYADYPYDDDKNRFCIDIIDRKFRSGKKMDLLNCKDILSFEYTQDYKNIGFKSNIDTIYKYLDTYKIKFYYNSTEHTNIESALKDEFAERWIKRLINNANK
jgi:uncharacterized FlaG/YvyC family protein